MDEKGQAQLVEMLTTAINNGNIEDAQRFVVLLANRKLKLDINVVEKNDQEVEKPFKIKVQVEDREAAGPSFDLLVRPNDKIEDLKKRVFQMYKFPVEVQKWIIGKRISEDKSTLYRCGVRSPTVVFLYLLTAHSIRLDSRGRNETDIHEHVDNVEDSLFNFQASSMSFPLDTGKPLFEDVMSNVPQMEPSRLQETEFESHDPSMEEEADENDEGEDEDEDPSWNCSKCTYVNLAKMRTCEICGTDNDAVPEDDLAARGVVQEEYEGLKIGERVVWSKADTNERGVVKWIGTLPDVEGEEITVGVECDNPVGVGNGKYKGVQLFSTETGHAVLVPLSGLCKDID